MSDRRENRFDATNVVSFDDAPPPGFINFGVGQPNANILSLDLMRDASAQFFSDAQAIELNYGSRQGDVRFLSVLSQFLESEYGVATPAESLFLTAGNSHALDVVCGRFTRPGDTVFVEEPSYFLAFQILRDRGLNIVGIPMDQYGLDVDRLESQIQHAPPTLVYTIPSFHNPTGRTMSQERRERLLALSRKHNFVIAADEVYQMLHCGDRPPPAFGTYYTEGNVLSLGSFSKIMAPAMRLGWIQTNSELMQALLSSGVVNSGGSYNHYASHIARHAMQSGALSKFIEELREKLKSRVATMDRALHEILGDLARWDTPTGGYFFWLALSDDTDSEKIRKRAHEFLVPDSSLGSCSQRKVACGIIFV